MIGLVLTMVWTRRTQAVTVALLALFAVASAVAAPAYQRAADRAIAAGQVATSTPDERSLDIQVNLPDLRAGGGEPAAQPPISFGSTGDSLVRVPGFQYVFAGEYATIGIEPTDKRRTLMVTRQNVCPHLRIVRGRCLIGEADVVLGENTADRLHLGVGSPIDLTYAVYNSDPLVSAYEPRGAPQRLVVAGIYQIRDPSEVYWGSLHYFNPYGEENRPDEPAFVTAATVDAMDHGAMSVNLSGYAGPGALAVDRLPAVRAGLTQVQSTVQDLGAAVILTTQLPALLARIDSGRTASGLIIPVLAVPLVLLACLSIFLAVGYGTDARRPELAVVALRGARWWQRWWLAVGENLVAIVAGAVLGCIAGQALVNLVAAVRFPGVGTDAGLSSLRYAPFAALAAVLAALLAERRQLFTPVAELLRRAPRPRRGARAVALEVVVTLLAVVAAVQLVVSGGTLNGVGTFTAAFIVLALALLAARALLPVITRYAGRALRRRRLGLALACFQLSRRAGAARLFTLLVAAVAVVGYAASAIDVAARDRDVQTGVAAGAARVLSVDRVTRGQLLAAVRAADPAGRYAMAVVTLPTGKGETPALAVDSTRLAAVATWPDGGPGARAVAARLRPPAPAPVVFPGRSVSFTVGASQFGDGKEVSMAAVLSSTAGLGDASVEFGVMRPGRNTYVQDVPECARGCRLNALLFSPGSDVNDVSGRIDLYALGGAAPAGPAHWRAATGGALSAGPDALRVQIAAPGGLPNGLAVQPVDTPYPMPAAVAGTAPPRTVSGLDGRDIPITPVARLPAVPALGGRATLIDLDYADRVSADGGPSDYSAVWLSAAAPADMAGRLAAHGLHVSTDARASVLRDQLNHQGPALALLFYVLVAVLAVALAAGALTLAAGVDRARRVEDLSALRGQGLGRGAVRQATLWTYPVLVVVATVAGVAIALIGWVVTGWALPLAGLHPPDFPLPDRPRLWSVGAAGLAVLVVLAVVAWAAGRRTLREIR
jgi:putative ABC transport system permease protein